MTALAATRLGWAAVLMVRPEAVLRVAGGEAHPDRRWRALARVLGARHAGQVLLAHSRRQRRTEAVALVDGLHAASAFGFGLCSKRHRRLAFADAAVATTFALSSIWYARNRCRA